MSISGNLDGFGAMGVRKLTRNGNFLLESPIRGYPVPAGFLSAVPTFGSWLPSVDCRPHECLCSPWGGCSGKTLVPWEIKVKTIVHSEVAGVCFAWHGLTRKFGG